MGNAKELGVWVDGSSLVLGILLFAPTEVLRVTYKLDSSSTTVL